MQKISPEDTALVALGANLASPAGEPADTLRAAFGRMGGPGVRLVAASGLYRTPCFPAGAGPEYVNAAAVVSTTLDPAGLLAWLHGLEAEFGRDRSARWGARTLDLDLIAHGDAVLPDAGVQTAWRLLAPEMQVARTPDRLVLPHPRLQDRAFVLVPLAEVAPDWVHPMTGQSVAGMLAALPMSDRVAVVRIGG